MIVATALGILIDEQTINYNGTDYPINYGYGDQKELNAWLINKGKIDRKFPLVWYVLNTFTEFDGWYSTDVSLYIFQNTESTWFNPKRKEESYTKIIEPTWQKVKSIFSLNGYVEVAGTLDKQYTILDEPNFGIDGGQDLKTSNGSKTPSTIVDITDARLIKFRLRINAKCIIN